MESIDIEAFKQLLRETMQWCVPRVTLIDPKHSLRTLPLNTESDLDTIERYELRQIAENLFQERARLLASENQDILKGDLSRGRLLICYPDESVWDGASEAASNEFFDIADIPAWDTWCYYGKENKWEPTFFIASWIPSDFIELVQSGIDVNPVECIQWAMHLDNEFTRALKTEGLLL